MTNTNNPQYPPFMTGSQVYGEPTTGSDYDMVVLVTDREEIVDFELDAGYTDCHVLRFGLLNIIAVTCEDEYKAWWYATDRMRQWHEQGFPVPKEQAIKELDEEYLKHNVSHLRQSRMMIASMPLTEEDIPF